MQIVPPGRQAAAAVFERLGAAAHRLDHEVDGRVDGIALQAFRVRVVDHAIGAEHERGRLLLRAAGADQDLARTAGARRHHGHQPDRARAEDRDPLADLEPGEAHAVHRHAERLAERRGREVDPRRQSEAVPRRHLDVVGEAARDREADHADRRAALVVAGEAVATRGAGGDALDRNRVTGPEHRHPVAHLGHLARDLVARADRRDHHLIVVPVQVRAADAAVAHADDDLARTRRRVRHLLDDQPADPAAEGGAHRAVYQPVWWR